MPREQNLRASHSLTAAADDPGVVAQGPQPLADRRTSRNQREHRCRLLPGNLPPICRQFPRGTAAQGFDCQGVSRRLPHRLNHTPPDLGDCGFLWRWRWISGVVGDGLPDSISTSTSPMHTSISEASICSALASGFPPRRLPFSNSVREFQSGGMTGILVILVKLSPDDATVAACACENYCCEGPDLSTEPRMYCSYSNIHHFLS